MPTRLMQRRAWPLVALCVVLLALGAPGAAAQEVADAEEEPEPIWSRLRGGVVVGRTAHFDVQALPDSPVVGHAEAVAAAAEAVLPTVEARLGTPLQGRVSLLLVPADTAPSPCPPRAAAFPARRRIVLFAGPETLEPRALAAFLAHELGHQLTRDRWGVLGNDLRLSEGIATWAAEPYWLVWRGWRSLDAAVADYLAARAFTPLAEPREGCLVAAERDVYYSAWASFVDFLARRYGWDRVGAALAMPGADEARADYRGAFGRSLEELSAEWEREVAGPHPDPLPGGEGVSAG